MMIGDAMTPFDPVLLSMLPFSKLNSMLPSLWFRCNQPPHFSMFPYSMLFASIQNERKHIFAASLDSITEREVC